MRAFVLLLVATLAGAAEAPTPLLRHDHFFVVVNETNLPPNVSVKSQGVGAYADGLALEIYDDAGRRRYRDRLTVGGELARRIPGGSAPFYLVWADPGMNGVRFDVDRPWGVVASPQHGLGTCGPVPRMFLYVPPECALVTLTCDAVSPREGGRVTLRRPDGSEALVLDGEFDTVTAGSADVPENARGKVWSLEWAAPQSVKASLDDLVLSLDGDLAPLLWPDRAWAEKHGPEVWRRHQAALGRDGAAR